MATSTPIPSFSRALRLRRAPIRLTEAALKPLRARGVTVPTYDRSSLRPSIVHIGAGAFHRAHQAVYFDDLAEHGILDWGVVGMSLRRPDTRAALVGQDWLYTVAERGAETERARVIGSLRDIVYVPDQARAAHARLCDPETLLVTLTVTGDAYDDPGHDAGAGVGAFALIAEALAARRKAGVPPFTVLSCDNLAENGRCAREATVAAASLRSDALAGWISREVAFPSSVVDRITPETTGDSRSLVADRFGVADGWPVIAEPFSQWVIEDAFDGPRPPLELAGAQFTSDVSDHATAKRRLLNGGHSALGYIGYLLGHRTTDEAMADPLVARFMDRLLREEIAPLLSEPAGLDLDTYCDDLLERFANPALGDTLSRLCRRGSTKVPAYLLPSLEAAGRDAPAGALELALAAWVRYLTGADLEGEPIEVADARWEELRPLAERAASAPGKLLATESVFGSLGEDERLAARLARNLRALEERGLRGAMRRELGASPSLTLV